MSDSKIVSFRKSKQGELVVSVDFKPLKHWLVFALFKYLVQPLYSFLQFISLSLDQITGRKANLLVSAGLGLGLGLGVMLSFAPAQIQASPGLASKSQGLDIVRIKSNDLGIDTRVTRGEAAFLPFFSLEAPAVHLDTSTSIGQGLPIVIQGVNKDFSLKNLDQAQIGDELFAVGSNNGWYRYTVIETRLIPMEQLNNVFSESREVLILYTLNPWDKTAAVVIARLRS